MIVVGLIVAIAFGFAAGWGWRHLDPQRKDVKGLFGTLLDRYALGNSTHDYEVMMLKSKLALANTRISSLELMFGDSEDRRQLPRRQRAQARHEEPRLSRHALSRLRS